MKKLSSTAFKEIKNWIYRNARPLELALWQLEFEDGSPEAVVERMQVYQNEDGGFGNAMEPDCWNTESSPYTTLIAVGMLREIGFMDVQHPMLQGIFHFLESGVHSDENGWHFGIPSNDQFPRAPWWTYNEDVNAVQDLGITAGLCAFILRYGQSKPELYRRAKYYVERMLERLSRTEDFGEMGAGNLAVLAADIEECGLAERFDVSSIKAAMPKLIDRTIERDAEKWAYYTPRPSLFIRSPKSPGYKNNQEIVEKELDYLIETRRPEGVWGIPWTWMQMLEQYAKEFAITENWWMANKAIENLKFLRAFDRIDSL